jgi:hypothetical protein
VRHNDNKYRIDRYKIKKKRTSIIARRDDTPVTVMYFLPAVLYKALSAENILKKTIKYTFGI